ncbi:MAG: hypothetical protein NZ742_00945 [Acidobacteria bacterium]|nr:hypothetical protein [Acidobacteriota bacterium]MDW7983301.1 hypothetical protein [Acidobacteriota bacterium]
MRFFISPDIRRNPFLRQIVLWSLVYAFLVWVSDWPFYAKIGFSYHSIIEYYRGSEAAFRAPKSFFGLLEETHFHAFAMMVFLMTLNHLLLFTGAPRWVKAGAIHVSFGSALADMASGWLIRFVHPGFALLKMGAFLALQGSLLVILILLWVYAWRVETTDGQVGRQMGR